MTMTNENKSGDKLYSTPNEHKIELFERVDAVKLRYILEHAEDFQLDELVHTWGSNTSHDGQLTILQKYLKKVKGGQFRLKLGIGRTISRGGILLTKQWDSNVLRDLLGILSPKIIIMMLTSTMPILCFFWTIVRRRGLFTQNWTSMSITAKHILMS